MSFERRVNIYIYIYIYMYVMAEANCATRKTAATGPQRCAVSPWMLSKFVPVR